MERHQLGLLNRALSEAHNRSEAEDLVQEAFLHAYQHLETLKTPDKFAGWLYSIICKLCHDARRKRRSRPELFNAANAGAVRDDSVLPDSLVDGYQTSDSIIKAVEALPSNTQRVFLLYLHGLYREPFTFRLRPFPVGYNGRSSGSERTFWTLLILLAVPVNCRWVGNT